MKIINFHQLANSAPLEDPTGTSDSSSATFFTYGFPLLNNNALLASLIIDVSRSKMLQTVLAKLMAVSSNFSNIEE